jgi:hypothetical protein
MVAARDIILFQRTSLTALILERYSRRAGIWAKGLPPGIALAENTLTEMVGYRPTRALLLEIQLATLQGWRFT